MARKHRRPGIYGTKLHSVTLHDLTTVKVVIGHRFHADLQLMEDGKIGSHGLAVLEHVGVGQLLVREAAMLLLLVLEGNSVSEEIPKI